VSILAAIQYKPRFATCRADVSDNFRRCNSLVNEVADLGAEVIVFPELAFTGYSFLSWDDAVQVAEQRDGPTFQRMASMAKILKCYVAWGFVESDGEFLYNSASLVGPDGALLLVSRKMNLWGNDFLWAMPSAELPGVVQTELGWMSVVICRDVTDKVPKSVGRSSIFSNRKVDLVAAPVNWSGSGFPATDWMEFAQNNSCALIVANRWGIEENRSFRHDFGQGGSVVVGKDAKPHIGGLKFGDDSVIAAMIDL
jgi:predicted amidohydrolase